MCRKFFFSWSRIFLRRKIRFSKRLSFGCCKAKLALFARAPMRLRPPFDIPPKFVFMPVNGRALPGPLNFMAVVFGRFSDSDCCGGGFEPDFGWAGCCRSGFLNPRASREPISPPAVDGLPFFYPSSALAASSALSASCSFSAYFFSFACYSRSF